jgi:hypothetical protein
MYKVGAVDPTTIPELSPSISASWTGELLNADDQQSAGDQQSAFLGGVTGLGLSRRHSAGSDHRASRAVTTGAVNNFVLMIRWSDCQYTVSSAANNFVGLPSAEDLDPIFNGLDSSVRDVYLKNSYGNLLITSVFSGWITVTMTEKQAAASSSGLSGGVLQQAIVQALNQAQANGVDFSQFDKDDDGLMDMITILHSGYAAEWGGANYLDVCTGVLKHHWQLSLYTRSLHANGAAVCSDLFVLTPHSASGRTSGACRTRGRATQRLLAR